MKRIICEIGSKFGDWTTLEMPYIKNGHSFVKVKCKCGKIQDLMLSDLTSSRAHSCRSCAARNRGWSNRLKIGDTVKNWTIIGGPRLKVHNIQFEVRCKCGYTRWIQPNELLNPNKCFSCKKCAHEKQVDIPMSVKLNRIQRNANSRKIEFSLTSDYLINLWEIQKGLCAITGDPLTSIKDASLDRINSSIGYIEGNVQWVTSRANISKHTMSMSELFDFCNKVLNHANQQPSQSLTTLEGSETNS